MTRVGHVIISVCCELPYRRTGPSTRRRHADSARPRWSDTRRRIGASFARTSQAFARFNPEIRTGAAELVEHSVRRPRPRVRRMVDNPLPHRTLPRSRSPANRRTPARHRGHGDSWLPLQRPCTMGRIISPKVQGEQGIGRMILPKVKVYKVLAYLIYLYLRYGQPGHT